VLKNSAELMLLKNNLFQCINDKFLVIIVKSCLEYSYNLYCITNDVMSLLQLTGNV